jgi:ribosomal protein L11 methyltransferase
MLLLTALGTLNQVRAATDELDRHDPSPAEAVSWFEEGPGKFRLEVYVPTKQDAASAQAIVGAAAPELHLKQKRVKAADWVAMSLEGLPAVRAGRFVVAGAHALAREHGGRTRIWIEASEAFGTGHHGTPWGCLMGLEGVLRQRRVDNVLDVGAGSGVLAIAAAKCGADALAIEIDPRAAAIAEINARQNKVANRVEVIAGDGARYIAGRQFDLVFAS